MTLSALVTGIPPGVRIPESLPGETQLQMVIRNHSQRWSYLLEYFEKEFQVPDLVLLQLGKGEISAIEDEKVRRAVEGFVNSNVPTLGRTFEGLAYLRENAIDPSGFGQGAEFDLCEILWPRQKNPSGDTTAEEFAESFGVTALSVDSETAGPIDFESILRQVKGTYFWILPGGGKIQGSLTLKALSLILQTFEERPKLAFLSDRGYCVIYRTAALRDLTAQGNRLTADTGQQAELLRAARYEAQSLDAAIPNLVKIEPVYGGFQENRFSGASDTRSRRRSWWRRLLGLG